MPAPSRFLLGAIALHVALLIASAVAYPGGTWWTPEGTHFDVLHNFWSDLLRPKSHRGEDNTLSLTLARLSLCVLGLLSPAFFWRLTTRYRARRFPATVTRSSSLLGSLGLLLVALGTGSSSKVHDLAILALGPFGLVALLLGAGFTARRGGPAVRIAALLMVAFSVWNMAQYVREAVLGAPDWPGLPFVQRLATLALWIWMGLVLIRKD